MKIQRLLTIDIFYNEDEEKEARNQEKRLLLLGYTLEHEVDGYGNYEYCDQYIKGPKVLLNKK